MSIKPKNRPQSIKEFQKLLIHEEEEAEKPAQGNTRAIIDAVFRFASEIGTKDALELFLKHYPGSRHLETVNHLLSDIRFNAGKDHQLPVITLPVENDSLTIEYREDRKGVISLEGADRRQGKEGVMVWENDSRIKENYPEVRRNAKGFWEFKVKGKQFHGLEMIYIPAGEFLMGSDDLLAPENEKPLHKVFLDGYWIGKYEITFDQFDTFCQKTGLYSKGLINKRNTPVDEGWGRGNRPVIHVSWKDASEYCKWLAEATGLNFKLPTEAQWEKAARGTDSRRFSWGSREPDKKLANFGSPGNRRTTPVNHFPEGASPYGVMDMNGNIMEWCRDHYQENYYTDSPKKNPTGPEAGKTYSKRGGAFNHEARDINSTCRSGNSASYHSNYLGFRVVMIDTLKTIQ